MPSSASRTLWCSRSSPTSTRSPWSASACSHFVVYLYQQAEILSFFSRLQAYAYWKSGKINDVASFDLYFRKNPFKGEFTIFAGLTDCLKFLENFHYSETDISYLKTVLPSNVEQEFYDFLQQLTPREVTVAALAEGSVCFPRYFPCFLIGACLFDFASLRIPLMTITGPLIIVQLLETTFLTLVNYSSLITTNAARWPFAEKLKSIRASLRSGFV